MSNIKKDPLFLLVKSLTKAEKRNFTLYVKRIQGQKDMKFVQLFELLDRQKEYDEAALLRKIPTIKKSQLSNLKRHLYKQLLTSLRMLAVQTNIDLEIREQLDFARILYTKGFYKDSLKILDRAKNMAIKAHQDILHLEILEFEKLIELRHITRSSPERITELTTDAKKRSEVIDNTRKLSNVGLRLFSTLVRIGHVRGTAEFENLKQFLKSEIPNKPEEEMTFFEKIYFYQCYVRYYHITLNFVQSYKYAQKWVDLFKRYPDMQDKDPDLFMQGYNTLLSALFHISYYSKFEQNLKDFESFGERKSGDFNKNSEVIFFVYSFSHKINSYFMSGDFSVGVTIVPEMEEKLEVYRRHLDEHRLLVFYYRIACLYFGNGENEKCIDFLNRIINVSMGNLREDIQCFARILNLIAHYELGHFNLLEYLVKSVYRFLRKMEELNQVQLEILRFLRMAMHSNTNNLNKIFIKLRTQLTPLAENPIEKRSFQYLDIISWLTAKIEKRSVQEVIREKFQNNIR